MSRSKHDEIGLKIAVIKKGDRGHAENVKMTWGELRQALADPVIDKKHTLPEYLDLPIDHQNRLKDVGSFVGGPFRGGLRKGNNLIRRSVVTLDIDSATKPQIDLLKLGVSDVCRFEFFGSTTRKHTKKKPRWRLAFPLTRPLSIDEYAPLSRILAATVFESEDASMDAIDDVSYRPAQVMYWPSVCKDALFESLHNEGELLNPDEIFESVDYDWRDWTNLPFSKKRGQKRPSSDKAEDPTTKTGIVGAFCRAYDVETAIDTFLPDIYEIGDPDSSKPRYTYIHGSSSNGAVVEDGGLFLYSHHGTDPCAEQLVNAFDLVRIHLFGELDAEAPEDATPGELPSFRAMVKMAMKDTAVVEELDDDYQLYEGPNFSDLGDVGEDEEDERPRKKDKKSKKTAESRRRDEEEDDEDERPRDKKTKSRKGPDLTLLRQSSLDAPKFPIDVLGGFWADRVRFWAKAKSAPVDYPALALIVGAASLIGNARRVSVHDEWTEPCILWGAVVGSPSSKKSPALDPIASIITEIERDWVTPYQDELREWEGHKRAAEQRRKIWEAKIDHMEKAIADGEFEGDEELDTTLPDDCVVPARPVQRRARIADTTVEALLYNLAGNPRGFMAAHDELSAWYSSFTRYAGSSSTSDRALWLQAFGGRPYTVDRVKHIDKPVTVPSFAVSLLGGIQPDRLRDFMKQSDDGLQARFLYAWPEPTPVRYNIVEKEDSGALNALRMLSELDMDLDKKGHPLPEILPMSKQAREAFFAWAENRSEDEKFEIGLVGGAFGKSEGVVARLALVIEHLWWCANLFDTDLEPTRVSAKAVKAAIRLREEYFKPMQLRVFNHGGADARSDAQLILSWLMNNDIETTTARDVYRNVPLSKRDAQAATAALDELVETGWLVPADSATVKTGRRTRKYTLANGASEQLKAA